MSIADGKLGKAFLFKLWQLLFKNKLDFQVIYIYASNSLKLKCQSYFVHLWMLTRLPNCYYNITTRGAVYNNR